MTDKQALLALADRCEQATGADRELDAAIFRAIGAPVPFQFANKLLALTLDEARNAYFADIGEMRVRYEPPAYTASLDAAMTLIDAECFWRLGHDGEGPDPSLFEARVFDPMQMDRPALSTAATPPLALTAATLRAIAGAME